MQILLDCVHFSRLYFPITSPNSMANWKLSVQISAPMGYRFKPSSALSAIGFPRGTRLGLFQGRSLLSDMRAVNPQSPDAAMWLVRFWLDSTRRVIRLTLVRALKGSSVVGVKGNFYSFSVVLWVSNRRTLVCGVRSLKSDNQFLLASFEIMTD